MEKDFYGDLNYFYKFMKEQRDFWSDCKKGVLSNVANYFQTIVFLLEKALSFQDGDAEFNAACQNINQIIVKLTDSSNKYKFYTSNEISHFIKQQYEI